MNKEKGLEKYIKNSQNSGAVLAETVLLIAISLVVVITIFYPTFKSIINETLNSLSNWFTTSLNTLGI